MRRDSIFYRLFVQSPTLLFELLGEAPTNASQYRFDSVGVKEPKFEIDGVCLPPESDSPGVIFFCELQMQKDEQLYERLFSEAFLYFYRNRERFSDWQAVTIYPSRNTEQSNYQPYRALIESDQVHRIYLDELGEISQLPLKVALLRLTITSETEIPEAARLLLSRAQQESLEPQDRQFITELVTTIVTYRFLTLTRQEIEAMLNITLQETRVYQDAKAEGKVEGREEGKQEGKEEEARRLVLRLLTHRLKQELSEEITNQITTLSLSQLEALGEALLDFQQFPDLHSWLDDHQKSPMGQD